MKKIKCFLMLSLIVILAVGLIVGCTNVNGVDREDYPNKITYCANGGDLKGKTERYLYVQDNVKAIEPILDSSAIIVAPTYSGYKFLGWAKCNVDSDGNPVLRDTPVSATDGGVWVNADGAITAEEAASDPSSQHKYYDYDASELWSFTTDIVTDSVALVAVWGEFNKFIIANANGGEWENLDDLLAGNVTESDERYEGYQARLYNVTGENGTIINPKDIRDAYAEQHVGYTAIRYYLDEELTQQVSFPFTVTDTLTVIYCLEIEGIYDIVTNFNGFRDAVRNNRNMYIDGNIDMTGKDISAFSKDEYNGTIQGNGYTISGVKAEIKQAVCEEGKQNIYGGLFGVMDGAEVYNLTVNMTVSFEIGIDPNAENPADDNAGTALDANCFVGMFAAKMTNCVLENVTVVAEYEITRKLVGTGEVDFIDGNLIERQAPNEFEVEVAVSGWQAIESTGNTMTDSTITVTEKETQPDEQ